MASINHILLDLLAHHLRADVAAKQKRIDDLKATLACLDLLIKEERVKLLALGNHAYMGDTYYDMRRSHGALIVRRRQAVEDIQYLDADRASSSNALHDIEHIQYEVRAASGLV